MTPPGHLVRTPFPDIEVLPNGRRRVRGLWLGAVHVLVFLSVLVWTAHVDHLGWRGVTVMIASAWLLIGPVAVVIWEHQVRRLSTRLWRQPCYADDQARKDFADICRLDGWRKVAVILFPMVLIGIVPWNAESLAAELQLGHGWGLVVAAAILVLGGFSAGHGLWAAVQTLRISVHVARRDIEADWSPFESVAAPTSEAVAKFAFTSAWLFAGAGAWLTPGLVSAAWNTDGTVSTLLVVIMAIIVAWVIALLTVPAWFLSKRGERHRDARIKDIAASIDQLAGNALNGPTPLGESDYMRLRSLLEVRQQLLVQNASPASVGLVKRIPVAILAPIVTTGATWLSLVQTH